MGRLDLTYLLETGLFSDLHFVCTDADGNDKTFTAHRNIVFTQCPKLRDLASAAPMYQDEAGFDAVHLDLDPVPLGSVLRFLYSGEYEAVYQAAATKQDGDGDGGLDDTPHPLFYSVHALQLAHDLDLDELYREAAAALCCSSQYFTDHADFAAVVDELYDRCGQHPQFSYHLNRISGIVAEKAFSNRSFQRRLNPIMLRHPYLALDVLEATMENLEEAKLEAQKAQEDVSDLRDWHNEREEFWREAERERQRDREDRLASAEEHEYEREANRSNKRQRTL